MNTRQRILTLRLLERQKRDPLYAQVLGLTVSSVSPADPAETHSVDGHSSHSEVRSDEPCCL